MKKLLIIALTASVTCGVAMPASADLIAPDEEACDNKEAGDSCSVDGDDGACVEKTCSRRAYSESEPPYTEMEDYDCLRCEPGAEPAESAADKKSGCSLTRLQDPVPLSLLSGLLGLGLLGWLVRRRDRTHG